MAFVKDPQNFAVFNDYATGWLYLKNLVIAKTQANPNQTIAAFFEIYAPSSDDNDPAAYAAFVAQRCGVPVKNIIGAAYPTELRGRSARRSPADLPGPAARA